ncbi:MAG: PrsW family intramembrane metalloprotease [Leptolyngbyaceae cyanobacterium SM1_1_3]|nr:PrsW family intramembrane metalloprotease [Leptolyngbyaceae cyanobacterium SM1_1_3]NJN04583.1 PrsW family intramembrane metalloprotease [Leptolyngbyaceae cyanobacterium RM1_1_2]NJO11417.1 PrsW family intramembrane metalloprotease [Leptolyngbyaceae cyanobacterium SL_1_1]
MPQASADSAFLKQISPTVSPGGEGYQHMLSGSQPIIVGRDPSCHIVLGSAEYQGVSRQHLEISPSLSPTAGAVVWQIRDLGSSNGTYLNGQKIQEVRILQTQDQIRLGLRGPTFAFECLSEIPAVSPGAGQTIYETAAPTTNEAVGPVAQQPTSPAVPQPTGPVGLQTPGPTLPQVQPLLTAEEESLRFSQLAPIFSSRQDLLQKGYLGPGLITVALVIGLLLTMNAPSLYRNLLGFYLTGAGFYVIYRLSGKPKTWWLLAGSMIATMVVLLTPILWPFLYVFRGILPGYLIDSASSVVDYFIGMLFGAGLMEELIKALPIFAAMWLGRMLASPQRERVGVWEPLDGIILGAASAAGFVLVETLGQYVPNTVLEAGDLAGIQLLIPRTIGSVCGHMAYSGYFGYFIGLSVLKPSKRWTILTVGYFTSSLMHALWNTSAALGIWALTLVGGLSYVFLVAAIIKARKLSPTRSQNFATQMRPPNL